jgi:hypothetical protein
VRAVAILVAVLATGCGDEMGVGKTFPVNGRVTLANQPVTATSTVVLFKPDSARGNSSPFEPTGTVDAEGNYTLMTKGKKGAPPGWYKVIVTANEPPSFQTKGPRLKMPGAKTLVPPKYGQLQTTDLTVEVVENPAPGAYDLKLIR